MERDIVAQLVSAHKTASHATGAFDAMHALIEFIAGIVAFLAAAALAQFGVDVNKSKPEREVRRVVDCDTSAPSSKPAAILISAQQDC